MKSDTRHEHRDETGLWEHSHRGGNEPHEHGRDEVGFPPEGRGSMKFRKKPVVIDAIQFTGTKENLADILKFCPAIGWLAGDLIIKTLEGNHKANVGDWIIKGVKGEFYPCKPDIFEQTYEKAE